MPMASRTEVERVLVTGCSGFTGRYVEAALLQAGYVVVNPERGDLPFDLTKPGSVAAALRSARPDFVIHLAAQSFVAHGDASAFYAVNTVGTMNLLDAILSEDIGPQRIVLASSANVYGNASAGPITESTSFAPANHYAASKAAMELLTRNYDRLPIVMSRPFNYTGAGQSENFLVPKLVAHFAERKPFVELGNLDVVRDFSDVRAIAQAYVRMLTAEIPEGVTNFCSGQGRALGWIVDQLRELSGHDLEVRVNPEFVRATEVHRLVGSSSRMNAALGGLPFGDFRATLSWMLERRTVAMAD